MTSHENFLSNVETAIRVIDIDRATGPATRNLVSVPLFHVTGCNSQLLLQVGLHGTTVVLPAFDVRTFLRTAADERIDLLTSVPAIYALALAQPDFAAHDLTAVSRIAYGGAPIAPALVRRIQEAFPNARVGNGFGLTETSSIATFLPHEWAAEHADSVGFAAPVVDLALDEPVDGVGELLVRGPNVVDGYWNKPEATAATFVDGWLHTGDLARVDDGLVRVVDRAKDMINRGGENVYSVEVENALAGAPGVAEAAVVGRAGRRAGREGGRGDRAAARAAVRGRADAGLPGRAPRGLQGAAVRRAAGRAAAAQPRRQDPQAGTCATARSGGRRCAELSPSRVGCPQIRRSPPRRGAARRPCRHDHFARRPPAPHHRRGGARPRRARSSAPPAPSSSGSCSSTATAASPPSSSRSPTCRAVPSRAASRASHGCSRGLRGELVTDRGPGAVIVTRERTGRRRPSSTPTASGPRRSPSVCRTAGVALRGVYLSTPGGVRWLG